MYIVAVCFLLSFVWLFASFVYTRHLNKLYRSKIDQLDFQSNELIQEKFEHLQKIERLTVKLEEVEKLREQIATDNKNILYDISHGVAKNLIDLHRNETNESRKVSEENINKSSQIVASELNKVRDLVSGLSVGITESKKNVEDLKRALLSPSSVGHLAEITLENILLNCGLRVNLDFVLQFHIQNDDTRLRPDALVFLPYNNLLIIDAKSSQFFVNIEDANAKNDDLLKKTLNMHLKNLSSKDYTGELRKHFKSTNRAVSRIVTLMFLPTEHCVEKIISIDRDFMQKCWIENIYPVGPIGLMNMLSLSKMQISEQMQIENYEMIIEHVKSLVDSMSMLSEHATKFGASINNLVSSYDKFAGSFNNNLLSKLHSLNKFGLNQSNKRKHNNIPRYYLVKNTHEIEHDEKLPIEVDVE